jgi:hypothetical protein
MALFHSIAAPIHQAGRAIGQQLTTALDVAGLAESGGGRGLNKDKEEVREWRHAL